MNKENTDTGYRIEITEIPAGPHKTDYKACLIVDGKVWMARRFQGAGADYDVEKFVTDLSKNDVKVVYKDENGELL